MAETLGSLCDKLTIVKLKQWHTEDSDRLASLGSQEQLLQKEIDTYVDEAFSGQIEADRLTFAANKVFKAQGNTIRLISGTLGEVFSELAQVNCQLWHEQEKVYDFAAVPVSEKDNVVKQLGILNLERNACIDQIDAQFQKMVQKRVNSL